MEIINISEENKELLNHFLTHNVIPSKFRYFNKRDVNCIKNHVLTILVSMEGKSVAYAHIDKDNDIYWMGICVIEEYQGKGIGKKIIEHIFSQEKIKELKKIKLSVDKDNINAINLYTKTDFEIVDATNPIYLIMERRI
jgi:ribosomal protein S18 acetylase RimI-like enzyme